MLQADERGRTYRGHDSQHLSINYLCGFALATGDRMAMLECEHHAELWLSEFTFDSGTGNDKPGVARAIGRSLAAGCWLWLVTGRTDIAVRIVQRTKGVVPVYLGAPNVRDFTPDDDAVILVSEFASPAELASYLVKLDQDEDGYATHLRWRTDGMSDRFRELVDLGSVNPMVRLARKLAHGCDRSCRCGGRLRDPRVRP